MVAWSDCTLGDLLEIKHGYAFLGEHFGTAGSHIVLTPGNFLDGGGFKDKGDKEKWYGGPIPADYVLAEGDLIIAMTEQGEGLLGSSALVPRSGVYLHNQRLGLVQVRDPDRADKRFLYHLFNSKPVRQQIRGSASGTKIRHTAPSRIASVKVRVPPVLEQRRIAGILSAYDELIENSQRRIQILETMARTLYREWFVHFRFPGHENVPRLQSSLGEIPAGWRVCRVKEIVTKLAPGMVYRATDLKPEGSVPVIDQSTDEILGFHDNAPGIPASPEAPAAIFGDHTCKLQLLVEPFSIGPNVVAFSAAEGFPTYYLFHLVKGLIQTQEYKRHWVSLNDKEVIVADPVTARRFASLIRTLVGSQATMLHCIRNLRRTRDMLVTHLLSGKIALKGAES